MADYYLLIASYLLTGLIFSMAFEVSDEAAAGLGGWIFLFIWLFSCAVAWPLLMLASVGRKKDGDDK